MMNRASRPGGVQIENGDRYSQSNWTHKRLIIGFPFKEEILGEFLSQEFLSQFSILLLLLFKFVPLRR